MGEFAALTYWLIMLACAPDERALEKPFKENRAEYRSRLDTLLPVGTSTKVAVETLGTNGFVCGAPTPTTISCWREDTGFLLERRLLVRLDVVDGVIVTIDGDLVNRGWP